MPTALLLSTMRSAFFDSTCEWNQGVLVSQSGLFHLDASVLVRSIATTACLVEREKIAYLGMAACRYLFPNTNLGYLEASDMGLSN